MHDNGSPIEFRLQEPLVGVVAKSVRHRTVAIGDHAVRGDDGVAFDVVRPNHRRGP